MTNQDLEYRALKIREQQPDLTQRQFSEALGVSLGKTHYILKPLIDIGWGKLDNSQSQTTSVAMHTFLLTGVAEKAAIAVRFLKRKKQDYDDLQREIAQLQREVQQQQELRQEI